jgi:hypothetical protein
MSVLVSMLCVSCRRRHATAEAHRAPEMAVCAECEAKRNARIRRKVFEQSGLTLGHHTALPPREKSNG